MRSSLRFEFRKQKRDRLRIDLLDELAGLATRLVLELVERRQEFLKPILVQRIPGGLPNYTSRVVKLRFFELTGDGRIGKR